VAESLSTYQQPLENELLGEYLGNRELSVAGGYTFSDLGNQKAYL